MVSATPALADDGDGNYICGLGGCGGPDGGPAGGGAGANSPAAPLGELGSDLFGSGPDLQTIIPVGADTGFIGRFGDF
jgi:hypothetical protein